MTLQRASRISLGLGILSLLSVGLATLALQDIYHGETDVTLEWRVLRVAFLVIITFHVSALIVAWKAAELPAGADKTQ